MASESVAVDDGIGGVRPPPSRAWRLLIFAGIAAGLWFTVGRSIWSLGSATQQGVKLDVPKPQEVVSGVSAPRPTTRPVAAADAAGWVLVGVVGDAAIVDVEGGTFVYRVFDPLPDGRVLYLVHADGIDVGRSPIGPYDRVRVPWPANESRGLGSGRVSGR